MKLLAGALILAALSTPALAAGDITIDVPMAFPESLSATADGTVYIGLTRGAVYRAMPGDKTVKPFISKEAGHFGVVLGVLADSTTDTLWVCDNAGKAASLKDHYMIPAAVTGVGNTASVLEAKFNYQRDPALKGKDPAPFKAYAVPLK